jgi:OOP family OmpA-OmpF porin
VNNTKKIAVAVAMLCASGATIAQEINPSWYIQPSVVGMKTDSDFGVSGTDVGGGLKFGKPVSELFDIQIGGTFARNKDNGVKYDQALLGIDSLLMFSRSNFRPFLLLGIGAQHDKLSGFGGGKRSQTSPYVTAGLGFQLGLSDRWSMQADYRTVQGHLKDDNDFGFSRSNNKYYSIGFNYAFNSPPVAAVAPAPEPTPVAVVEAPPAPMPPPPPPARFEKVTMSATELFEFDKAVLRAPQPKLDEIAAALQADMSITDIDVTGYTDRLGSDKYNQRLSERRAVAVREYLVARGIDGSRLKAVGKGEANPVVECNDKKRADLIACLAPNRRVEVEQITIEKRVR